MKNVKINFANSDWKKELTTAYSFRFTETPEFTQKGDHVTTVVNTNHREGFDNISLLYTENTFSSDVTAKLTCSFDDIGCPEIIIVKKPETCEDGAVRYGECFEVVLWKNGVNVWRHFMDENYKCSWHKRLGLNTSFTEGDIHNLTVTIKKNYISFDVDGISTDLRVEDIFDNFYVGITACEGIVRLYDFSIEG